MKRTGYLYERICDLGNLRRAFEKAVQGKRKKRCVQRVITRRDELLLALRDDLLNERFVPAEPRRRTINEPASGKQRDIAMPRIFPDHVVHWAVCLALKDVFMKGMYARNVGCIPGRGCSAGISYVKRVLRHRDARYILKIDLRKYFQHISHSKLKSLLRRKIKDVRALHLLDLIIDAGGEGLPLGFYSSQWLANFYLEEVDHYIKERLGVRYYVRNVDDMVMIDGSGAKLHRVLRSLRDFLKSEGYGVEIKPDWQIWPVASRPLDFLGFRFYAEAPGEPGKRLMRKRNFFRMSRRVSGVHKKGFCTERRARQITSNLGQLRQTSCGRHYYTTRIRPIIRKGELSRIISAADRARSANETARETAAKGGCLE